MKIEIDDIKFWADAIRNSEDRDRVLECFWGGQLRSKSWLVDHVEHHCNVKNAKIVIYGGWYGVLSTMLFNSNLGIKHITSVDIDPKCKEIATTMNKRYEMEGRFTAVTEDMCTHTPNKDTYMVINTSCEHITQEQYNKWLSNIPDDVYIVLQSNNFKDHNEHINCMQDLGEFKRKSKLKVDLEEELELPKYKRFLICGRKR
tara:strand:- start:18641 stop:19246 length:606 start_codon:yes stop_codon:yes gene_type:complete